MTEKKVILGKITGAQGVQGWLKVYSYTRPAENIFQYTHWDLQQGSSAYGRRTVLEYRHQGKKLVVKLEGVENRTQAEELAGYEIAVSQNELPDLEGEYYWRDLIGLTVRDTRGNVLGEVVDLMETGSNDVLLLKDSEGKSLAIPWLPEVVIEVNTEQSLLIADWEPLV